MDTALSTEASESRNLRQRCVQVLTGMADKSVSFLHCSLKPPSFRSKAKQP